MLLLLALTVCLLAEPADARVRLAIVADFGWEGATNTDSLAVSRLIRTWDDAMRLDALLTLGDNNYPALQTARESIESNSGRFYSYFMYPYRGYSNPPQYFGAPDGVNRFFPITGNNDWDGSRCKGDLSVYLQFYAGVQDEMGNPQYFYRKRFGPVEFFMLDSDCNQNQKGLWGNDRKSRQAMWLQGALANSTAAWKVVMLHHPPFSSGSGKGSQPDLQWPYQEWGAHMVLAAHEHSYERFNRTAGTCSGFPYVVNGMGGRPAEPFRGTEKGSVFRQNTDYGAQLVTADEFRIDLRFRNVSDKTVDCLRLEKSATNACGFVSSRCSGEEPVSMQPQSPSPEQSRTPTPPTAPPSPTSPPSSPQQPSSPPPPIRPPQSPSSPDKKKKRRSPPPRYPPPSQSPSS